MRVSWVAALGDKNRALEFLEKANGDHEWVSVVKTPPDFGINNIAAFVSISVLVYLSAMFRFLGLCFGTPFRYLRSHQRLLIECIVRKSW